VQTRSFLALGLGPMKTVIERSPTFLPGKAGSSTHRPDLGRCRTENVSRHAARPVSGREVVSGGFRREPGTPRRLERCRRRCLVRARIEHRSGRWLCYTTDDTASAPEVERLIGLPFRAGASRRQCAIAANRGRRRPARVGGLNGRCREAEAESLVRASKPAVV